MIEFKPVPELQWTRIDHKTFRCGTLEVREISQPNVEQAEWWIFLDDLQISNDYYDTSYQAMQAVNYDAVKQQMM